VIALFLRIGFIPGLDAVRVLDYDLLVLLRSTAFDASKGAHLYLMEYALRAMLPIGVFSLLLSGGVLVVPALIWSTLLAAGVMAKLYPILLVAPLILYCLFARRYVLSSLFTVYLLLVLSIQITTTNPALKLPMLVVFDKQTRDFVLTRAQQADIARLAEKQSEGAPTQPSPAHAAPVGVPPADAPPALAAPVQNPAPANPPVASLTRAQQAESARLAEKQSEGAPTQPSPAQAAPVGVPPADAPPALAAPVQNPAPANPPVASPPQPVLESDESTRAKLQAIGSETRDASATVQAIDPVTERQAVLLAERTAVAERAPEAGATGNRSAFTDLLDRVNAVVGGVGKALYKSLEAIYIRLVLLPGEVMGQWFETIPEKQPYIGFCGYRVVALALGCEYIHSPRRVFEIVYADTYVKRGIIGNLNAPGFLMDYANLGLIGVMLSAGLLGLIIAVFSGIFAGKSAFLAVLVPYFALTTEAPISLILNSGGLGIATIILLLMRRQLMTVEPRVASSQR
jgi:hypothetical protein